MTFEGEGDADEGGEEGEGEGEGERDHLHRALNPSEGRREGSEKVCLKGEFVLCRLLILLSRV